MSDIIEFVPKAKVDAFHVGDVVCLKSGGPPMLVRELIYNLIVCLSVSDAGEGKSKIKYHNNFSAKELMLLCRSDFRPGCPAA